MFGFTFISFVFLASASGFCNAIELEDAELPEVEEYLNEIFIGENLTSPPFGSEFTLNTLPLRIPPDLKEHVEGTMSDRQGKSVNSGQRSGRQISPGVYSCGHQGSEMFINVINPHYPGHDVAAGTCHFRMLKNKPEICQIRVDFVDTEMLTPNNGNCHDQYLMISGTIWPVGFQRLCGINPDQHFYIHMNDAGSFDHIDFSITTVQSNKPYKFGIWITQINCHDGSAVQAPGGCSQYHFGNEGIIKTFNFEGVQYLAGMNYKICIRAEQGSCFIGFAADTNHFMLQVHPTKDHMTEFNRARNRNRNSATQNGMGMGMPPAGCGDDDCTFDWLLIPGARGNLTRYGLSRDRFCGGHLNTKTAADESIPIYTEITSQIIWLQFVSGLRDPFVLAELARSSGATSTRNTGFFGSGTYRNDLNEGFDGTGPGIRMRYSQLRNCLDASFIGN